jgi:hypothetical protein
MHVENKTPFDAQRFVVEDAAGRDMLVVVVKATYRFDERGATALAEEQVPLAKADSHYGEPGQSSTREESDFAPFKPASDVALIGDAWAPRGRATEMDVALRVGPVAQRCRVFGERRWVRGILGYRPSAPYGPAGTYSAKSCLDVCPIKMRGVNVTATVAGGPSLSVDHGTFSCVATDVTECD